MTHKLILVLIAAVITVGCSADSEPPSNAAEQVEKSDIETQTTRGLIIQTANM